MTLDVIKPRTTAVTDNNVSQAGIDALVGGMSNGTVINLHSAVECVNAALETRFGGAAVRPHFNDLIEDLMAYSAQADKLASEGNTVIDIFAELNEWDTKFTLENLQQMKIEVYGSVLAWLEAMTVDV